MFENHVSLSPSWTSEVQLPSLSATFKRKPALFNTKIKLWRRPAESVLLAESSVFLDPAKTLSVQAISSLDPVGVLLSMLTQFGN